jgi:hypothetical protein
LILAVLLADAGVPVVGFCLLLELLQLFRMSKKDTPRVIIILMKKDFEAITEKKRIN